MAVSDETEGGAVYCIAVRNVSGRRRWSRETETSAHRIEGEADPLLVVTAGAPGLTIAIGARSRPVGQRRVG